jgi:hypothetical protein
MYEDCGKVLIKIQLEKNPIKKSQGGKRIPPSPHTPWQIGLTTVSFFASWCEVNWYDIFVIQQFINLL